MVIDEMTPEELEAYQAQQAAIEAARQAELARIAALEARFNAIPDVHLAVHLAGLNQGNPALILKHAMETNDDTDLQALEAQVQAVQAKANQEQINRNARKLLADTDWLIVREIETGVVCPADIKAQRASARASIVD